MFIGILENIICIRLKYLISYYWFGFIAHQPLMVINAKSIFKHINSSISNIFVYKYSFCACIVKCQNSSISNSSVWHTKAVPFQANQLSIRTQFSSISPIDRTLSGATTLSQSEPRIHGNEGLLYIPLSFSITGASPSDFFGSYPGHLLVSITPLQRRSWCILQPQLIGQGHEKLRKAKRVLRDRTSI